MSKSVSWLSPKVSPRGQSKQGSHDDPKPQTLSVCWWPIHAKMVAQDVLLRLGFLFGCCLIPVVIDDFKMVGADLFPAAITSLSGFCPQQAQNVQGPSDSFLLFPTVGWRL
jgi:hypothetical protein